MTVTGPADTVLPLSICLFGPFEVRLRGAPLPRLRTRKGQWLLALLTLRAGCEVERAWLAGTLWPDSPQSQALGSLRMSLGDLRAALGPEADRLGSPSPHSLRLDLAGAEADVVAFDAAIAQGDGPALERAVALYRGPLLEECVEAWVLQERQAREQAYLAALESLAAQAMTRGDPAAAERPLRLAVGADPLRESAQRGLMQALAAGGNYAAALLAYRELRLLLHRELNAEPDPETTALFRQLQAEAQTKAVLGARYPVLGEGSVVPSGQAARPIPTEHLSQSPRPSHWPQGTVTFLFTDVEGSTRLWEAHPHVMPDALARHDAVLHEAIEANEGTVFKTFGDQFCAAFATAPDALAAALAAQRALVGEPWPEIGSPRVRMALHTGAPEVRGNDYFGPPVNRVARLLEAGHGGQILLSLATRQLARDDLPEGASLRDLGEHRLKDLAQPEHIFQFLAPGLPSDFPPLNTLDVRPHNLPAQPTPLIGRETEVAAVRDLLLREEVRLATLTGPGGTGKTRLALQVAADLLDDFADGVFFVSLASISDPALVVSSIAQKLGVRETGGPPLLESLKDYVREKQLLLLLDNFEQVLAAAPRMAELLASCPRLKVLVTSRALLHLRGEHEWQVPPLPVPDPKRLPPEGTDDLRRALSQYAAVELFIQRAVAAQSDFAVTNENAPAVAEICYRLDGLPLAIELAAARIRLLSPQALLSRLESRLKLLTGGARDVPARHQTLRGAIAWSHDLLEESEKRLFRRLSVFVGGCTLEAAEAVCKCAAPAPLRGRGSADGLPPPPADRDREIDVLDGMGSLVDRSLVQREEQPDGELRFGMLETIREFALECLAASGEEARIRRQHADFFVVLAERAEPALFGGGQGEWLDRLEREHDNLRAALEWSGGPGEVEAGLRLGGAVWRFWHVRDHVEEGRERLARVLWRPEASGHTAVRAKALDGAGVLALRVHDLGAARSHYEEMLSIGRELDDKRIIATALNGLGEVALFGGDFGTARPLYEESLAVGREVGDKWNMAFSLMCLGNLARFQGDNERACSCFEESLTIWRELGDKRSTANSLTLMGHTVLRQSNYRAARSLYEEALAIRRGLGEKGGVVGSLQNVAEVARHQGDYGTARSLLAESLAISRELRNREGIARSLQNLGLVAHHQGDDEAARSFTEEGLVIFRDLNNKRGIAASLNDLGEVARYHGDDTAARALFEESLAIQRKLGEQIDKSGIASSLANLAMLARKQGDDKRAARLFGAAEALREALGAPLPPIDHAEVERSVATVRAALGEAAFAAAWAAGQAMPLEQTIADALEPAAGT